MNRKTTFPLYALAILMLLAGFACSLTGSGDSNSSDTQPYVVSPTAQIAGAIQTSVPESSEVDPQEQTWLILFYLDADDPVLEEDIYFDLNEIEMAGSTNRVQMVAQIDRYNGEFSGDGDWTSTRRYLLTQDDDLNSINSEMIEDLGEVDMGDSQVLVDFATWAINAYPTDKVVLIMSDHGAGYPGGWTDVSPARSDGNWIYLVELEDALSQIIQNTGIEQFELIGMDACLMSMLEVYNGLAPYAHYAVASQETEPALGWAYEYFLSQLISRPEMNGEELSTLIVDGYINKDQRVLNDEARQTMMANYGYYDSITADELVEAWNVDVTLSGVDLTALPQLNAALDGFVGSLKNVDQANVAEARSYAQAYVNVFDEKYPSPYIDLGNFAEMVATSLENEVVNQANEQLQAAIANSIVAEKHGNQRPGSSGISIYFPVSDLYWNEGYGVEYYIYLSRNLARYSMWDDFLAFHYAGTDFGTGTPSQDLQQAAPGASKITIEPLTVSDRVISPEGSITIETNISGDNVAYIYLVGLLKHNTEDKYLAYYIDYLFLRDQAGQEVNGVIFPDWQRTEDGLIHINTQWNLAANGVCDEVNCVFALVNPDKYTTNPENLLYFVEGWYIFADSGERVEASMYFYNQGNNLIRHIIASPSGNDEISSPRELIPQRGDQFMTVNTIIRFDDSGQFAGEFEEGNLLSFSDTPLYYGSFNTPDPGNYLVGIMVMDMDGNKSWQFAPVTVSSPDYEVTPEDFSQQGMQQSDYEEPPAQTAGSFTQTWQSASAKTMRSILIPLIGGLIGVLLTLILGTGKPKPYSPYVSQRVPPAVIPPTEKPIVSAPPELRTNPPELITTPPVLQTEPPKLTTTQPPMDGKPPQSS